MAITGGRKGKSTIQLVLNRERALKITGLGGTKGAADVQEENHGVPRACCVERGETVGKMCCRSLGVNPAMMCHEKTCILSMKNNPENERDAVPSKLPRARKKGRKAVIKKENCGIQRKHWRKKRCWREEQWRGRSQNPGAGGTSLEPYVSSNWRKRKGGERREIQKLRAKEMMGRLSQGSTLACQ